MKIACFLIFLGASGIQSALGGLPGEPVPLRQDESRFVFKSHWVDNHCNSAITVRVSDWGRKVVDGFDQADSVPGGEDETRQNSAPLDSLAGKFLRREFYLRNADLFSFGAD